MSGLISLEFFHFSEGVSCLKEQICSAGYCRFSFFREVVCMSSIATLDQWIWFFHCSKGTVG